MSRRVQRPELDASEREFNRLMRLNPVPVGEQVVAIKQVCMHVDRTLTSLDPIGAQIECDYCDSVVFDPGWGPVPDLMPYVYLEKIA